MNDREILIGMLEEIFEEQHETRRLITPVHTADYLIDNGVTIQKHGRWKEAEDGDGIVCSACGTDFCTLINETEGFNYCPNCGARMEVNHD